MKQDLKTQLKKLPQKPGVYVFLDGSEKILYVGKANNLKNRVRSYFAKSADLTAAKRLMVSKIDNIDYTVVDNEAEALLLETNFIKEHRPPYNIILKDDKYWQYIKIDYSTPWTSIYAVRRPDFSKKEKVEYFGPFTSGAAVKEVLRQIKKLFPICLSPPLTKGGQGGVKNPSRSTLIKERKRPCFNYHLNRCLGPCVSETTPAAYRQIFNDIKNFIKGDHSRLLVTLHQQMVKYSQHKHYEAAARLRDQVKALMKLNNRQKVVSTTNENVDLVSLYRESKLAAVNVFQIRSGKLIGRFNSVLKNINDQSDAELLDSFMDQYYSAVTDLPKQVFTSQKITKTIVRNDTKIEVSRSQRGKKSQLLKLGERNAYEHLKQNQTFFDRRLLQQEGLAELQKLFKLRALPRRIEMYDIANVQGVSAVGGMVVFEHGHPKKSDYRKFTIKTIKGANDPGMMAEMLERRLNYLPPLPKGGQRGDSKLRKPAAGFSSKPDLIVLDGGKGQLGEVNRVMRKLKLKLPMIALAKQEEDIYILKRKTPIKLPKRSNALKLLMQIRDETHRYANTFFKQTHARKTFKSALDEIPGIGPKTKKLLKTKLGSTSKIKKTSLNELSKLVGPAKAKTIKKIL